MSKITLADVREEQFQVRLTNEPQPATPHAATLATPLTLRQSVPGNSRSVVDSNGDIVATANSEDEGNAIVQAVNSHAALVEALQNIRADCETAQERRKLADFDFAAERAIGYADAALALAGK